MLLSACAEGGIDDAELGIPTAVKGKSDAGSRAHDARVSSDETADSIGSSREAGSGTGSSVSSRDAGSRTSGASPGTIKCPSPMVCNSAIAMILSALDPSVNADQSLCAENGGLLPMAVSCQTVDECKSARLTTSTCSAGNCIQPCTP